MVDIPSLRNEVKILAEKAVNADKCEDYENAFQYYSKAAEKLNYIRKYDENQYNKDVYTKKAIEYINRAKDIKKAMEKGKGKDKKGGNGEGDEDEEAKKLEEQLSGCLVSEKPNVKWSDVAGLDKAKEALKEAVVLPIRFPQLFQGKRKPWKGILLYGPPGTGKSFLAKAAATETGGKFFSVSAANIVSKWMGESEKLIKGLFDLARKNRPAVIFLDEIDSVLSARSDSENDATRRLKTEFLIQMQGVGNDDEGILVLGATNIPWGLDPAVRRRFQKKIYIGLPEVDARRVMFQLNLGKTANTLTEEQFDDLAERTEGYSGSDIATLTQDAIYGPLRKCQISKYFKYIDKTHISPCSPSDKGAFKLTLSQIRNPECLIAPKVSFEDYVLSVQKIKATVNEKDLEKHKEFTQEFGQQG